MARARSKSAGFSLMELMVVVTIIAVVVAIAAPSISAALAERRTARVSYDVVRAVRVARTSALAYGRAHLLRFTADGDDGLGTLEVYRGINTSCNAQITSWATIVGEGCAGNAMCLSRLSPADQGTRQVRITVDREEGAAALNTLDLCYEPNGITRWRAATGDTVRFLDTAPGGGFVLIVQRFDEDGDVGVARRVLLPLGTDARIQR